MAHAATHYTVQPRGLESKGWLTIGLIAAILLIGALVGDTEVASTLAMADPNLAA